MAGAKFVFRPGEGLFAQGVQWTARAKQMLDDDEYRYQSATFSITPKPVTCWPLLALRSPTVLP